MAGSCPDKEGDEAEQIKEDLKLIAATLVKLYLHCTGKSQLVDLDSDRVHALMVVDEVPLKIKMLTIRKAVIKYVLARFETIV